MHDDVEDENLPPAPKTAHLWPWFLILMTLLIGGGFWVQKDAWLDNRWFRSTLINIGIAMPMRPKDWHIAPESVQSTWVRRDDGSQALLIHGRIDNLMRSDMPLPRINITFFSAVNPNQQTGQSTLPVTLPPSDNRIRKMPYIRPAIDTMPVPPLGSRNFTLLVESIPDEKGDFTLTVTRP